MQKLLHFSKTKFYWLLQFIFLLSFIIGRKYKLQEDTLSWLLLSSWKLLEIWTIGILDMENRGMERETENKNSIQLLYDEWMMKASTKDEQTGLWRETLQFPL